MSIHESITSEYKERTGLDLPDDQSLFALVEPDGFVMILPLTSAFLDDVDSNAVEIVVQDMMESRRLRKEMKEQTGE